jgi:putative transposase
MPNYRRSRIPGGCYFFTVVLAERGSRLLVDHIAQLRLAVATVKARRPFTIDAFVVLPDHLHCVWTLPDGDADYSRRWEQIKNQFSRSLPMIAPSPAINCRPRERGIWQRRFWEHMIRDDDDYAHHVEYTHFNPVKHGYVVHVADWPHSSFHRAVRQGLYPADWAP